MGPIVGGLVAGIPSVIGDLINWQMTEANNRRREALAREAMGMSDARPELFDRSTFLEGIPGMSLFGHDFFGDESSGGGQARRITRGGGAGSPLTISDPGGMGFEAPGGAIQNNRVSGERFAPSESISLDDQFGGQASVLDTFREFAGEGDIIANTRKSMANAGDLGIGTLFPTQEKFDAFVSNQQMQAAEGSRQREMQTRQGVAGRSLAAGKSLSEIDDELSLIGHQEGIGRALVGSQAQSDAERMMTDVALQKANTIAQSRMQGRSIDAQLAAAEAADAFNRAKGAGEAQAFDVNTSQEERDAKLDQLWRMLGLEHGATMTAAGNQFNDLMADTSILAGFAPSLYQFSSGDTITNAISAGQQAKWSRPPKQSPFSAALGLDVNPLSL